MAQSWWYPGYHSILLIDPWSLFKLSRNKSNIMHLCFIFPYFCYCSADINLLHFVLSGYYFFVLPNYITELINFSGEVKLTLDTSVFATVMALFVFFCCRCCCTFSKYCRLVIIWICVRVFFLPYSCERHQFIWYLFRDALFSWRFAVLRVTLQLGWPWNG